MLFGAISTKLPKQIIPSLCRSVACACVRPCSLVVQSCKTQYARPVLLAVPWYMARLKTIISDSYVLEDSDHIHSCDVNLATAVKIFHCM